MIISLNICWQGTLVQGYLNKGAVHWGKDLVCECTGKCTLGAPGTLGVQFFFEVVIKIRQCLFCRQRQFMLRDYFAVSYL